ncbi:MAG: hypothetical protein SWX82_21645 [Cyanobacteriota bacterium]|nr:hypothetical protein [Cyanobacteriota bacterium]
MIDDLNSASTQIQPGSTINGIVGGFVDNGEDFILNFSGGTAIVDTSPLNANQLGLNIGESVNVLVTEFDDLEINAESIATPDDLIRLGSQTSFTPPPPPVAPDPITGFNPVTPPPGNPIFGTVVGLVDNDEFFLQDVNGAQILVDTELPDTQFLSLVPGEQVNVTGIFDDNDFEAFSVTRTDGSPVYTAPPANPISGTVVSVVDNDEFLLQDTNGTQILVDTDLPNTQFLSLVPGEQVNVVGNFDDDDFDAFSVTRLDGSPVFTNTPVSPPPPANPVLPPPPPFNPVTPPPGNPIFGTVVGLVDNDEFFLQDVNGAQILVDTELPDTQFLSLVPGEQVNVTGIFDDNDFEAFSVTRTDGSPVYTAPPANPISGTVVSVVDNDEFLLQDANGTQILVDTDLPNSQFLSLVPGEQVNVVGNFDDDDFDAFSVTRLDGSPVFTNTPVSPPPPANPVLPPPPPFNPVTPPPGNSISGTVVGLVDNDEFFLQDANGAQILVDTELPDTQFLNLVPGEQVNVTGIFDDNDFEAFSVTRLDGSPVFTNTPVLPPPPANPVLPPPPPFNPVIPPPGNPIFGTVVGLVDNDEFFLQDVNGTQILVDTGLPDTQFLNLVPGEQVNVTGIFDDNDFEAFSVTRPDGSVVFSNTPVLPPPSPGFNPVIPPQGNPFGTVVGIVDNDEFFQDDDDDDDDDDRDND